MDKAYNHKDQEEKLYSLWEKAGSFTGSDKGDPYTILMPPPNANASLHAGHAMYTVDDILARFKRMQGFSVEWLPGADHAGFETQYVYEKHLAKQDKSRMDFDRATLYSDVYKFVKDNSGLIFEQMKRLGFSADWDRTVFTLDDHVVDRVYETFKKMHAEGLIYRDSYIVNYCVHDGTSLAELEVKRLERTDPLFFVKYPLVDEDGFVVVATVRPEPIYIDTHLAVNPKDKKNKHLVGKKVKNPLTDEIMEIIADDYVDPEFGTGVVKLTPGHDANDFEVAKKHNLPIMSAIDLRGKMIEDHNLGLNGLKVKEAREKAVQILQSKGLIEKIDENYSHNVITCYKCGRDLEPLTIPNWFIKVADLKKPVTEAVEKDTVKFYPKKFKRHMLAWLDIMHDWPISRQIVWGIQIPAWYSVSDNPDMMVTFIHEGKIISEKISDALKTHSLQQVKDGIQNVKASPDAKFVISQVSPGEDYLQETDTFDTWFSSGQWPLVTVRENEFESRYPTDFMGTLSDILKFWISRMIMFGLYLEKEVPFKNVYLWSMVADSKGVKMSKSKGNVVNPIELVDKYGADALRMTLIYGIPAGSKAILSEDKVRGMRNFSNKIWNATRFINMLEVEAKDTDKRDAEIEKQIQEIVKQTTKYLDDYKFDKALENLYEKFWHWYCDIEIEQAKEGKVSKEVMIKSLETFLVLLHPFAPFVTEASYQEVFAKDKDDLLINHPWPKN